MALKDELIQKVLRRSKPNLSSGTINKYNHFKIYEVPPTENRNIPEHKPYTNHTQTGHKLNTKPDTNLTQSEHRKKVVESNHTQTEHATEHNVEHKPDTNHIQTGHKYSNQVQQFPFSSYVGLQRNILIMFYYDCKISRSRETQEISLQHVADSLNIRIGSVKTSIRRLEEKEAVKRTEFKNGRSGWSKYELHEHIYREIMHHEARHKLDTNWLQTKHKPDTQPDTQPDTSVSSSSISTLYNKNTTTSENHNESKLSEEWRAIDIESLSAIGFTKTHLIQISQQGKLTSEVMQASIHAFAFDLFRNKKIESLKAKNIPPLNYFMGVVRNGLPYTPPDNYESPEQEAMRLYVERQRELEQKIVELEKTAFELAFKDWLSKLTEEEKNNILPMGILNFKAEQPRLASLREHFRLEIWNTRRTEIMQVSNPTLQP